MVLEKVSKLVRAQFTWTYIYFWMFSQKLYMDSFKISKQTKRNVAPLASWDQCLYLHDSMWCFSLVTSDCLSWVTERKVCSQETVERFKLFTPSASISHQRFKWKSPTWSFFQRSCWSSIKLISINNFHYWCEQGGYLTSLSSAAVIYSSTLFPSLREVRWHLQSRIKPWRAELGHSWATPSANHNM